MQKLTVGLVCAVLVLFVAIFGAYNYKTKAANADWQQPRMEGQQPIGDYRPDVKPVDPKDPSKLEEPLSPDNQGVQPVKPGRKPIIGVKPEPTPIKRPGYILPGRQILRPGIGAQGVQGCGNPNCPVHGNKGNCGPNGCGPNSFDNF